MPCQQGHSNMYDMQVSIPQQSKPPPSISTWNPTSGFLSRRPTTDQWKALIPDLFRLKRNGYTNMELLQVLLDEGYITSLSTLERKLRSVTKLLEEVSCECQVSNAAANYALHPDPASSSAAPNLTITLFPTGDFADTVPVQTVLGAGASPEHPAQHTDDNATAVLKDMSGYGNLLDQSPQIPVQYAVSIASSEKTAASRHSGHLRSVQDSSDRTIETESNCPSMLGRMLQTKKRAQRKIEALKTETLKPRLPPSVPSSGQKVEEWDTYNDDRSLRLFLCMNRFEKDFLSIEATQRL